MRLLILGAGRLGSTLGLRWAAHGHDVIWSVRDASSPQRRELAAHRNTRFVGPSEDPGEADAIVVATPAGAALDALSALSEVVGRVVIDCTNPVAFDGGIVSRLLVDEGSMAERIAARFPGARVVKTLNQVGSDVVADPAHFDAPPLMYVAGDDGEAKSAASTLVAELDFEPLDAGALKNAFALEALALLWMHGATTRPEGRHSSFALQRVAR